MSPLDVAFAAAIEVALRPLVAKVDLLIGEIKTLRDGRGDEMLTIDEAAELAGTTSGALRKKIDRGSISVVRLGRSIRIRRADLIRGAS